MTRVLLAEDDKTLRTALSDALANQGYEVTAAADGQKAHDALLAGHFDCVVLDLMLPKRSGLEVLRDLRSREERVPVLILTAKGDESDKVLGLELGADDYVTKPFGLRELLARVKALLRRGEPRAASAFTVGASRVDLEAFTIERGGEAVPISRKEAAMLELLWEERGKAVSRERFLREVWGGALSVGDRAIDTHVLNLRKKLGPEHLQSVHGVGYKLVGW
jgi:DNA-binding response OmpR family regulator